MFFLLLFILDFASIISVRLCSASTLWIIRPFEVQASLPIGRKCFSFDIMTLALSILSFKFENTRKPTGEQKKSSRNNTPVALLPVDTFYLGVTVLQMRPFYLFSGDFLKPTRATPSACVGRHGLSSVLKVWLMCMTLEWVYKYAAFFVAGSAFQGPSRTADVFSPLSKQLYEVSSLFRVPEFHFPERDAPPLFFPRFISFSCLSSTLR